MTLVDPSKQFRTTDQGEGLTDKINQILRRTVTAINFESTLKLVVDCYSWWRTPGRIKKVVRRPSISFSYEKTPSRIPGPDVHYPCSPLEDKATDLVSVPTWRCSTPLFTQVPPTNPSSSPYQTTCWLFKDGTDGWSMKKPYSYGSIDEFIYLGVLRLLRWNHIPSETEIPYNSIFGGHRCVLRKYRDYPSSN